MKTISNVSLSLSIVTLLFCSNGCTTYNTVQYAKGYPENVAWFTWQTRDMKKPAGDHKAHPAYYALTPLTVPVDVVTFPVQYVDYWYVLFSGIGYE